MGTFYYIIIFVGIITFLNHFIFTYEGMYKGNLGSVPKVGCWMMLMTFGASFENA